MFVDADHLLTVYLKIRNIREEIVQSVLRGDSNVLSVEDLRWVIGQMYGLEIRTCEVEFQANFVRGMMERRTGAVIIRLRARQEEEWKRFTAVKEMCHCVLDESEDWSPKGVDTLEDILSEHLSIVDQVRPRTTQSEALAELAALELMYPYECRLADQARLDKGEVTVAQIALDHQMPQAMVSRALSEHHKEVADAMWGEIAQQHAAE